MIAQKNILKLGLAAGLTGAIGLGLWAMNQPSVAVNKSSVPAHKCCSTWEDHMRASGVDQKISRDFDIQPLFTDGSQTLMVGTQPTMMRH